MQVLLIIIVVIVGAIAIFAFLERGNGGIVHRCSKCGSFLYDARLVGTGIYLVNWHYTCKKCGHLDIEPCNFD